NTMGVAEMVERDGCLFVQQSRHALHKGCGRAMCQGRGVIVTVRPLEDLVQDAHATTLEVQRTVGHRRDYAKSGGSSDPRYLRTRRGRSLRSPPRRPRLRCAPGSICPMLSTWPSTVWTEITA